VNFSQHRDALWPNLGILQLDTGYETRGFLEVARQSRLLWRLLMLRRSSLSRRPSMESLETRCNPSTIDPLAGAFVEPPPVDDPVAIVIDLPPQIGTALIPIPPPPPPPPPSSDGGVRVLTSADSATSGGTDFNLNAFAGQTVRILIQAADASTASQTAGSAQEYEGSRLLYTDVFIPSSSAGGGGLDVLIGNTGGDRIGQTGGISKLGSKLLVIQGEGTYQTNDDNSHGTHVAGTIAAEVNNGVGAAEASGGFGYAVLTVGGVSRADVDGDGFFDIIVGAEANGHVKAVDGTSGPLTGSFRLTFQGASTTVSGRVTAIAVDESDSTGNTYYSQPNLESIIDDLARDVAEATANRLSTPIKVFICPSDSSSAATGAGASLHLKPITPTTSFPGFTGGVYVAAGDVNGDGAEDDLDASRAAQERSGGIQTYGDYYTGTVTVSGDG
jgi:hypothetical protein